MRAGTTTRRRILLCALLAAACKREEPTPSPAQTPERTDDVRPALPAAQAVPDKRATLPAARPKVGQKITVTRDSITRGTTREGGGHPTRPLITHSLDMTEHWVRRFEVLAIDGDVITDARVTFPQERFEAKRDGETLPWSPHWLGHAYMARWRDGALQVSREDGTAMSEKEDARLRSNLRSELGQPDVVGPVLARRELVSGEVIPLPAAALAQTMADGVSLKRAEARLIDVRDDVAVIEIHLAGEHTGNGLRSFEARTLEQRSIVSGELLRVDEVAEFRGTLGSVRTENRIEGSTLIVLE